MKKSEMVQVQSALKEAGLYSADLDGIRGDKTDKAIKTYLSRNASEIKVQDWQNWSASRMAVAALQLACSQKGIEVGEVDGLYGPQTESASEQLAQLTSSGVIERGFGDIVTIRVNPHQFPMEHPDHLTSYYGAPCDIPLIRVECPWTLRLDWDLSKTTQVISIHQRLADSLRGVLQKVYAHYGDEGIRNFGLDRYGGSYNCRKKRGSLNAWSTHAWGISIDWFPSKNKLKWRSDRASLAHPDLDYWWEAWEQEGWLSLGRAEDRDWMHVQAAKR